MRILNRYRYFFVLLCMALILIVNSAVESESVKLSATVAAMIIGLLVLVLSGVYRLNQKK